MLHTIRYTTGCTVLDRFPSPLPLTLADWAAAYADGASPEALLEHFGTGSAAGDPAWIHRASAAQIADQVSALRAREARHGDRAHAMRALPLFGVPFAVKDNIDVAGWPTTAACPAFAYEAPADATVVARLRAAGAICVGKTNLDQFATGLVGTRSPYGRPGCTFDDTQISGGSSSGSAVVVSRGLVPFALGTDTAGSGRVPAGFNHIVGLKPTPGRVSTAGVVPACRSLDCVSIFALDVDDAATVLSLVEGDDPADIYSAFAPRQPAWGERLRVGVPREPDLDPAYAEAWRDALARLQTLGLEPVPLDFGPLHATAELLYGGPWVAERHVTVEALLAREPEAFDPTVRQIIEGAAEFSATDSFRAQYALQAARRRALDLWSRVDLLLTPTAPGHPSFAEVDADPIGVNARLGRYTNFVNLLGWCALALPSGWTTRGLPFGVTAIAPAGVDRALAALGRRWADAVGATLGATGQPARRTAGGRAPAGEPCLTLAVVGAHLRGLPLNSQLVERGAEFREATQTAPAYRFFALPGTTPPKPGLVRVAQGGGSIAVELWDVPLRHLGSFLAGIPAPLGLGSLTLQDGRQVHGFVCEAHATEGALDITGFGGWRAFLQHRATEGTPP